MPPLPIVYQGIVTVDGKRPVGEMYLTVRINDWVSNPVVVVNGEFVNLIAGPPNATYVGEVISFHLGDLQALETDIFTLLGVPEFSAVRLTFGLAQKSETNNHVDGRGDELDASSVLSDELPAIATNSSPESNLDDLTKSGGGSDDRFSLGKWGNAFSIGGMLLIGVLVSVGFAKNVRNRTRR